MNSRSWVVQGGTKRWIAKAVPAIRHSQFEAGLAVAAHVEAAGIPAGSCVPTRAGSTVVALEDHVLALLSFVEGAPLTGRDEREQRIMGTVLAQVHQALAGSDVVGSERFHWIDPAAPHLGIRDWIRPAIEGALEVWDALLPTTLTWGLLHTDPAGEAFLLHRESGVCGLIDWDRALVGPFMYDVASAVMYGGGPGHADPLVEAYTAAGLLGPAEIERALSPMLRFRWAVQADYFARRIATGDLTGIDDPSANEDGLEDARRGLR